MRSLSTVRRRLCTSPVLPLDCRKEIGSGRVQTLSWHRLIAVFIAVPRLISWIYLRTYNMSTAALAQKLAQAKTAGKLPKVVIPVHFAGQSCDMEAIHRLSREYGFRVIEDASHAVGGRYQNRPIGSCQYSDITVFSFHPVKIITTAEGGMALTNSAEMATRMERLRSHGITRDPSQMTGPSEGSWYYQQIDLGMNYRMADLHAALGFSQMARLDAYVARRHEIARVYDRAFAPLPGGYALSESGLPLGDAPVCDSAQIRRRDRRPPRSFRLFAGQRYGLTFTTYLFTCSRTIEKWGSR